MAYEPSPAVYQGVFAAPTATASVGTKVMCGLGGTTSFALITPQVTGRILLLISGSATNTNGNGTTVQLSFGTGTAPVNGAALTGTQIGQAQTITALTGLLTSQFALQAVITGLAVPSVSPLRVTGTAVPVWLDLAFACAVGGSAALTLVNITAFEF